MVAEVDPEWGQKALDHQFELFIRPELERRLQEGTITSPYEIRMAQVIFSPDGSKPKVRLNEEVRAVAKVKPSKLPLRKGQAVMASDVAEIEEIELTGLDPNE